MIFYRNEDINAINNNIKTVIEQATEKRFETLEPTLDEYKSVMKDILSYIKKHKKIVYGGVALNQYLISNKHDPIYDDKHEMYDIEFYSSNVLEDVKNLCDFLHEKKYIHINGKSGAHDETYKIFVNFQNYCDISYMPGPIMRKLPYKEMNGVRYVDPKIMFIDKLRMYNNLLTTSWRIEKEITRTNLMLKYLDIFPKKVKCSDLKNNEVSDFIRKTVLPEFSSTCITIGYYAYNYFKYKYKNEDINLHVKYYEMISTNFYYDTNAIYKLLKTKFDTIITKEFYPFTQFFDRRVEYYDSKNNLLLIVYKNNNLCIPYIFIEKKQIKIGPFLLVIMYLMMRSFFLHVYEKDTREYDCMINSLIEIREKYLTREKKTVMDDTPFKDFIIECIGKTEDQMRTYFLKINKKREQKKQTSFNYKPGDNFDPSVYKFKNSSGNIINNTHFHVIQNKNLDELALEDLS